jgi:Flp pilus assembly protein TadD
MLPFRSGRAGLAGLALAAMLALAGCSSGPVVGSHGGVTVTGSTLRTDSEIRDAVTAWGERYDKNSKDRTTVINYAAALRLNGQADQAVAVLSKGKLNFPNDDELSAAYGKALADNGDFEQALTVIQSVQQPDRPDWKLYSAEGAILDQMGRTAVARDRYAKALAIVPGEPSVLNNLALSHLLAGEMDPAEKILREAAASPRANSRIRQNLALVLGLKGRFDEAEAVAKTEIDPVQAAANVAYLRSMLAQANTWKQIKDQDGAQKTG